MNTGDHIYLVRHGETEWALSGRHTGHTDVPLTARGEDQARKLAPRLQAIRFSHVFASPQKRAVDTCSLAGLGAGAEIDLDLEEWDYGDYEGRRSVDIRAERADWMLFRDGCPHGETPADVSGRADRLIARLRRLDGNVALFSHGQFASALAVRWIGLPLVEAQHFSLGTASLGLLGKDPHHPEVAVIDAWNAARSEAPAPDVHASALERKVMKQGSIERWENEGGEVVLPGGVPPGKSSDG